ncbi:unnamed protein product, partial [Amoebophrya sp. A25]
SDRRPISVQDGTVLAGSPRRRRSKSGEGGRRLERDEADSSWPRVAGLASTRAESRVAPEKDVSHDRYVQVQARSTQAAGNLGTGSKSGVSVIPLCGTSRRSSARRKSGGSAGARRRSSSHHQHPHHTKRRSLFQHVPCSAPDFAKEIDIVCNGVGEHFDDPA